MIKQLHLNECDSTQDILKEQLSVLGNSNPFVVSCEHQKNGRGRGLNSWTSHQGSLCFSLNLEPHPIISLTALEISVIITKFFEGSILSLKWPNDIWDKNQKKCAGILIQSHQGSMITGIGLNLFSDLAPFGGVYDSPFSFDKKSWSLEIANFILQNRYKSSEQLKNDWEKKCGHLGHRINITEGNEITEGIFSGLGEHGQAVIKTYNGEKHFYNGSLTIQDLNH